MQPKTKKDLEIVQELSKSGKPIEEQLNEFKQKTGKEKATFYRYKRFLSGKAETLADSPSYKVLKEYTKEFKCYFCGTIKEIRVHHRDGNTNNNVVENILPLCSSCHAKLHHILRSDAKHWV